MANQHCLTLMIDFYWGSFKARKHLNNRHKSDLIQYKTGHLPRRASGPVQPSHPLHILHCTKRTKNNSRIRQWRLLVIHFFAFWSYAYSQFYSPMFLYGLVERSTHPARWETLYQRKAKMLTATIPGSATFSSLLIHCLLT